MNDRHQHGVELIAQGLACGRRNEMESGVLCLVEGLGLIDEEADPRLTLCALHNLALFLSQLGLPTLARAVLARSKPIYRTVGDPLMMARLLWLEGSVARLSGRWSLAQRKLEQAFQAFERIDARQAVLVRDELAEAQQRLRASRAA